MLSLQRCHHCLFAIFLRHLNELVPTILQNIWKYFFYIFFFILHLKTLSWCLLLYDFNICFGSYNYTLHNKNGTLASPLLMFASRKNIKKHHILRWISFYQNEKIFMTSFLYTYVLTNITIKVISIFC